MLYIILYIFASIHQGKTRDLGRVVCRGNNVTMCAPEEGYEAIENPFNAAPEEEVVEETTEATKE